MFELKTNITFTFKQVYSADEYKCSQDVVVTCFFLDTARNVLDYIELIHQILKPGGHWINLGPLLYHFADSKKMSGYKRYHHQLSYPTLHFNVKAALFMLS